MDAPSKPAGAPGALIMPVKPLTLKPPAPMLPVPPLALNAYGLSPPEAIPLPEIAALVTLPVERFTAMLNVPVMAVAPQPLPPPWARVPCIVPVTGPDGLTPPASDPAPPPFRSAMGSPPSGVSGVGRAFSATRMDVAPCGCPPGAVPRGAGSGAAAATPVPPLKARSRPISRRSSGRMSTGCAGSPGTVIFLPLGTCTPLT